MPFSKNNKLGFTSDSPLEKTPICFNGRKGQREKLMKIDNWKELLRDYVDKLIQQKPS